MSESKPFDFFELHDSILEKLEFNFEEHTVLLEIKSVGLYFQRQVDLFEVWNARARIILRGVKEVAISGHVEHGALIINGGFLDANDQEGTFAYEGQSLPARSFFLESLCYQIHIECEQVTLDKIELIGRQDDWIGPLTSSKT